MTERQSLAIDYLKAFGIIAVVTGHYDGSFINFIRAYMFHMPLFFFVGGMLFKSGKKGSVFAQNIFLRYILYIAVSYTILWFSVYALSAFAPRLEYPSGSLIAQTIGFIKSNFHSLQMFFVSWFLVAYMLIVIISYALIPTVEKLKTKFTPELIVCLIAIVSGFLAVNVFAKEYAASKLQIYNTLSQVSFGLMFFLFGYAIRNYIYRFLNKYYLLAYLGVLFVMRKAGVLSTMGMSWSIYKHGFFFSTLGATLCIIFFLGVSYWLATFSPIKVLRDIGKHSKAIMTYHLLMFAILNILLAEMGFLLFDQIVTYQTPKVQYTKYLFLAMGIFPPLLGSMALGKIKGKIRGM